jgi:hypothetical protein
MASVKINLKELKEIKTKERKARLKHSIFFITINSNKRFEQLNSTANEIANKLSNFVATTFDDKTAFKEFLCSNKDGSKDGLDVEEIGEFDGEIELSHYTKSLHLHGMIPISHRKPVYINLPLLREKMLNFFKDKYHLDVIKVQDNAKTLQEYKNKNPARFEKLMNK